MVSLNDSFDHQDGDSEEEKIVSDLNLTPLIDIMMVLLIIFMVTSSISIQSGLDVNLPKSKNPSINKPPSSAVIVEVTMNGDLWIDGDYIESGDLVPIFKKALKKNNTKMVNFRGDNHSTLGRAMKIMDEAKKAGAQSFFMSSEMR